MTTDGLRHQVRAVNACNSDSVEILNKNKKLQKEVAALKQALLIAQNAARDAEARERQRMDDGAATVEQLMKQLQAKDALLAAGGAGGGGGYGGGFERDP
jgi:hypothetical protein